MNRNKKQQHATLPQTQNIANHSNPHPAKTSAIKNAANPHHGSHQKNRVFREPLQSKMLPIHTNARTTKKTVSSIRKNLTVHMGHNQFCLHDVPVVTRERTRPHVT